jgi:hypothetical protein
MKADTPVARRRAEDLLRFLLPVGECLQRFDASYLDDLPEILKENHGIVDGRGGTPGALAALDELRHLSGVAAHSPLAELAPALRRLGIADEEFRAPRAPDKVKRRYRYDRVAIWKRSRGVVVGSDPNAVALINELQAQYSTQSGGAKGKDFTELSRDATGDPWTPLVQQLIQSGSLDLQEPVLTIGPRWIGEIKYFRDTIGLQGAIGLDLFSYDPAFIKVGDMHSMPFPDATFGLIYQRNTFNKSYDIRQALRECLRTLRPGGVLISDDCLAYTDGVSELARTSIPSNRWMLNFLGSAAAEVLYDAELPSGEPWFERIGQLAVRIKKGK